MRITRSGGYAGRTHTLVVRGDGAWTRLDGRAQEAGTGRLAPGPLAALSAALREAGFPRLPRVLTGGETVFDGFTYAFVYGGFEVAADQTSLTPSLAEVLEALPPFTAG
ncbi:hypothetical protein [Streptomyces sp. NPDC058674]|uniref:hypothetical protein n=1 Tax=Streptomyces sp. NPDC058674 TaxID=3346592 RepID=UPI00364F8996